MFAFKLAAANKYSENSSLQIGGYDEQKHAGNQTITWNSLIDSKYWSLRLSAVSIGEDNLPITTSTAVIDTGTSFIVVPRQDLTKILNHFMREQLACAPDPLTGLY